MAYYGTIAIVREGERPLGDIRKDGTMKLANVIDMVERRIKVTDFCGKVLFEGFSAFAERNLTEYLENEVHSIDAKISEASNCDPVVVVRVAVIVED